MAAVAFPKSGPTAIVQIQRTARYLSVSARISELMKQEWNSSKNDLVARTLLVATIPLWMAILAHAFSCADGLYALWYSLTVPEAPMAPILLEINDR